MENHLEASSASLGLSKSNAKHITVNNSEEEYSVTGSRRLFSNNYSFSEGDLKSLNIEENTKDESSERREACQDKQEYVFTPSTARTLNYETQQNSGAQTQQWRGFFKTLKKQSKIGLHTFSPRMSINKILSRRKSRNSRQSLPSISDPILDPELSCFKSTWVNFSLPQLETATDNFSKENLIGEGGYAEVYKGHLKNGQLVAIKRLTRGSPEEMTADFLSELGILVHTNHPNIANVIGYGVEGGMHLVLHLSAHGSLASLLTGNKDKLEWGIRYKIALGTAEGLAYLHEACQRRIIHRDIKAANILLGKDFEAQISDFGLAKWLPEKWTHLTITKVEGTFGYLPPEFFLHGVVDEKTDVYAYGVLLLEIISGRLALDKSQKSLVMWAKLLLADNKISELIDPLVFHAYDTDQFHWMILTATSCLHECREERPHMGKVVQMLKGQLGGCLHKCKKFQRRPGITKSYSGLTRLGSFDAEDFNNSTNYLTDNNQMQIALELK